MTTPEAAELQVLLEGVSPDWPQRDPQEPEAESGEPPGGSAYTDPSAEPGAVRERRP